MSFLFFRNTALIFIVVFACLSASSVSAVGKLAPKISQIVTSNTHVRADGKDMFSLRVVVKNLSVVKKTDIIVDGKVIKTCKAGVSVCQVNAGPFAEDKIGEHVYQFNVVGKNGTSDMQWGNFWVTVSDGKDVLTILPPKTNLKKFVHNTSGVGVLELVTTKNQYTVGEKGNRLLLMRGHGKVASIQEGEDVGVLDTYSAGRVMGPFTDADIGKHTIEYTITGFSGETVKTRAQYWVVPKGSQFLPPKSDFE